MADYDLSNLVAYTRRRSGDRLIRQREVFTTTGESVILLNNEGYINIISALLAGNEVSVAGGDFTQDVNVLTFDPVPVAGAELAVVYENAKYTDEEVSDFLVDAMKDVSSEFKLGITASGSVAKDANGLIITATDVMAEDIENLVVLKAALNIREDVTNIAAGDAIKIKDGDTAIDTSATAGGNEKRLKAMKEDYEKAFNIVVANRTPGVGSNGLKNVSV